MWRLHPGWTFAPGCIILRMYVRLQATVPLSLPGYLGLCSTLILRTRLLDNGTQGHKDTNVLHHFMSIFV